MFAGVHLDASTYIFFADDLVTIHNRLVGNRDACIFFSSLGRKRSEEVQNDDGLDQDVSPEK